MVLEIYSVDETASSNVNAERVSYIKKQYLSDTEVIPRFFDSRLDEVLVNLCASRVLSIIEREKEAAVARQQAEEILKQQTI